MRQRIAGCAIYQEGDKGRNMQWMLVQWPCTNPKQQAVQEGATQLTLSKEAYRRCENIWFEHCSPQGQKPCNSKKGRFAP